MAAGLPALLFAAWAVIRLFWLERGYPLVPAMAFTPYVAAAAPLAMVLAVVLREWRAALLAAAAAVALAVVVLPRTIDSTPDGGGRPVVVLSANVAAGAAPPEVVVRLVARHRPDVLSLQELTPGYAQALQRAGLGRALPHSVLEPRPRFAGTGLYARFPLRRRPPIVSTFSMARAVGGGLDLVAVHPPAPLRLTAVPPWRRGLRALPPGRGPGPPRVLAGDFNATQDHGEFRRLLDTGYADAAVVTGDGLAGTWPDRGWRLPPVTIDHVLTSEGCTANRLRVLPLPRSDHRAVLAALACGG